MNATTADAIAHLTASGEVLTWDDLAWEDRRDLLLQNPRISEWYDPEALDTLVHFRPIPQEWAHLKARYKEYRGDPFDLQKAVDAVRQLAPLPAPAETQTPQASLTTLADVQESPVEWLWPPYLAKGTIAMIDGDPGLGKSLLTLQLAASLSRGFPLPDQTGKPTLSPGGPQHVLLITSEDSPEHTIKPRLLQAGGDPTKVHILNGWTDPTAADPTEIRALT